jgi:cytochrome oxidase Cu insertion factor (SCO1/SenC/PrrC family)
MSIDATYQSLHDTAKDLRFQVQNVLSDPDHPSAQGLIQHLKDLLDDYDMKKHPRNIEERIKNILGLLRQARSDGEQFMSVDRAVTFFDRFEDMRRAIRGRDDYI